MKRIDWNKAEILANMYKTSETSVYISRGSTFEESIQQDVWTFKFRRHPDEFVCGEGVDFNVTAGAFSLNVLFVGEEDEYGDMPHIDFDVGVDL